MHELVHEAVNNLAPRILERNAAINYDLRAATPVVNADRNYMLIVITNLLDNAIKYSREPQIEIDTNSSNQTFILSVKDNGIGIERGEQKKIFRKFYRVRSGDTYAAKGFGLGLTFIKKILVAHHAKIKLESVQGQGSKFEIELPIH
jgi:two-component system phosphate regulon sensor histidine kinase PhoR